MQRQHIILGTTCIPPPPVRNPPAHSSLHSVIRLYFWRLKSCRRCLVLTFRHDLASPSLFPRPIHPTVGWLSNLDPIKAHRFSRDFGIAQETVLAGVSPGRAASGATAWSKWIDFTRDLGIDPFLQTFNDKVPFLQIFAQQVHSGKLAARGNPLRS